MRALASRAEKSLCETAAQALCLSEQRQHKAGRADLSYGTIL